MLAQLGRWLLGTGLVSWRYLWMITPLHRHECRGDDNADLPPAIPRELLDDDVLLGGCGVGPLFHRRFTVHIEDARCSAERLMSMVAEGFHRFVPREVVGIARDRDDSLDVGQEFVVQMPGPWNGPVRVIDRQPCLLRLATLQGHLEAGQIQFSARDGEGSLTFQIEAWSRCASPLVQLLYTHMRLAKEVQLNMWVRFCLSAAKLAGGRPRDGVHVSTRRVPELALPLQRTVDGKLRIADGPPAPVQVYPFRFAEPYRLAAAPFGVTPTTAEVTLAPEWLEVRFGPWRLRTPRSNIASVRLIDHLFWPKTAGPARLSLADQGITFATNGDRAVCVTFHEPTPAIEPTGRVRHPGMTVTLADPSGFAAALP
ncbi:MAG: DUF1990 family protein [Streptosporangiales bacterium]